MKGTGIQLKPRKSTISASGDPSRMFSNQSVLSVKESTSEDWNESFSGIKAFAHAFMVTFRYIMSRPLPLMGDFVTIQ